MKKEIRKYAALVLLALLVTPAYAVQPGGYVGFGFGQSDDDVLSETDNGWKVFGGANLSPNLGLELAFVDLGEFVGGVLTQSGVSYHLVGYVPVSDSFDLFGKIGLFAWKVDAFGLSNTGTDLTYGFGGEYRMTQQLALRVEWETYQDVDGGDVDLVSAGLSVRF